MKKSNPLVSLFKLQVFDLISAINRHCLVSNIPVTCSICPLLVDDDYYLANHYELNPFVWFLLQFQDSNRNEPYHNILCKYDLVQKKFFFMVTTKKQFTCKFYTTELTTELRQDVQVLKLFLDSISIDSKVQEHITLLESILDKAAQYCKEKDQEHSNSILKFLQRCAT